MSSDKMSKNQRVAAVLRFMRARHSENKEAKMSHEEIAAATDHEPLSKPYYDTMSIVRLRLLDEGIALGNDIGVGYAFLNAEDHGDRNRHRFHLLVDRIDIEVLWAETFIDRVEKYGEDPGMSRPEFLMVKAFARDTRRAVAGFRGQFESLAALRREENRILKIEKTAMGKVDDIKAKTQKKLGEMKKKVDEAVKPRKRRR